MREFKIRRIITFYNLSDLILGLAPHTSDSDLRRLSQVRLQNAFGQNLQSDRNSCPYIVKRADMKIGLIPHTALNTGKIGIIIQSPSSYRSYQYYCRANLTQLEDFYSDGGAESGFLQHQLSVTWRTFDSWTYDSCMSAIE